MRVPQIKVLVVDDHQDYCAYVALLLKNELGDRVRVETTRDALTALSLVVKFKPEIVVMAMSSPHFQPEIFIKTLRKRHPYIDVLAMTTNDPLEAERMGATKAFLKTELNPKLTNYIANQNWGHLIARRLRYFGFPNAQVI